MTMRENASLTDPAKLSQAWEVGLRGIDTMSKYTTLNRQSSEWSVTLEQAPMGESSSSKQFRQVGSAEAKRLG